LSSKALKRLPSRQSVASLESELSMSRDPTKERLAISAEISRSRQEHVEQLQSDADTILERYAGMVPEALDALTPEERHRVYKMLRLRVVLNSDGSTEITGVFGESLEAGASGSVKTEVSSRSVPTAGRS